MLPLATALLAQCLTQAAGEVYQMRDVRTCHGFEKSYAKCEGLPACTKPCEPRDCGFAPWEEWYDGEGCSGLCYRHRRIQTTNNECGMPCTGPQIETKGCPKKECVLESQDCTLSTWSDWSSCGSSKTAQRYRSRRVMDMPKGHGVPCLGNLNETAACDERQAQDCVLSEWGLWTECSAKCDGGYRAAIRTFVQTAEHGGRPCDNQPIRKTEPCNMHACNEGTAQDCEVGEWTEWQGCDAYNPQQRYRTRQVDKPAQGEGKACEEVMKETSGCILDEKPEDCVFSEWSAWGECDKSCGGGQTYRKRVLASEPQHGGVCALLANLTETKSCNVHACFATKACALMPWSDWGACSASCDIGLRKRSRELVYGEQARRRLQVQKEDFDHFADGMVDAQASSDCSGGFSGSLHEVTACAVKSCGRADCAWGAWAEWSPCTCTCGGGTRERSRSVETFPDEGGMACAPEDKSVIEACNTQSCLESCEDGQWGEWSGWSTCSASCGSGYRARHRDILQHPNHCGKPVTGLEDDYAACTAELKTCEENRDCKLSEWTKWTPCSCTCNGVSERTRTVVSFPSGDGKACESANLKEVEMCNTDCAVESAEDCQMASWGDWGDCTASCGTGYTMRMRHVLSPAKQNGALCDASLEEVKPCNEQACRHEDCVDCSYSVWSDWGACSKCGGQRYRHRNITHMNNECGVPCDMEDTKQTGECHSECDWERWCAWTEWTSFGGCSAQCGPATKSRQRVLRIHEERPEEPLFMGTHGMTCEGMQLDTASCEFKSCSAECEPVDCNMGEWGDWSKPSCSQLCERTRIVQRHSSCGGEACSGNLVETKSCPHECQKSLDCELSEWDAWSECKSPDGQKTRKRTIRQEATYKGTPCEGHLTETDSCSSPGEPTACELTNWGAWSACTKSCGGLRQRTRAVQVTATNGGAPCEGGLEELVPCNVGSCQQDVQDCQLSEWGAWKSKDPMYPDCGPDGQHWRSRDIVRKPSGGGRPCEESLEQIKSCNHSVACELSEWSEWGSCDKPCGGGQQLRHRQVTRNPLFGGKACEPVLMLTKGCNEEPCSMDKLDCEVGEWAQWSQCTAKCGAGQRQRERKIVQQPRNGGLGCGLELSQLDACNNEPCATVDCLWSDWDEWSDCSCKCGGGQRTRNRRVKQTPQPGGKPCEALAKEEVAVCNTKPCNEHCVDGEWEQWEEWAACSATCKGGVTYRSRKVKMEANHCGEPATGPMRENAKCNEDVSCVPSVDCVFADWQAWSDCTSTCSGVKRRSRQIATHGRGDGKYCTGRVKETAPCNPSEHEEMPQACRAPEHDTIDCQMAEWEEWSTCSATCGGGSRDRERVVTQPPSHGGAACESVLKEVSPCSTAPCEKPCEPKECVFDEWGEWSACDKCGGQRKRFRSILEHPNECGSPCEVTAFEEVSNCTRSCHDPVYCMWGEWKEWSACTATCGEASEKVRIRHLETTTASLPVQEDFDLSAMGADEAFLQDTVRRLEEHTQSLRTRRLQNLGLAFGSGGLALVVGLALFRGAVRHGSNRARSRATFHRLPLDGQE